MSVKIALRFIFSLLIVCVSFILWIQINKPIYPDEVAYRILNSRTFQDGTSSLPSLMGVICQKIEAQVAPFVMIPARVISSAYFSIFNSPLLYRITGIVLFYLFLFQLWMIVSSQMQMKRAKLLTFLLTAGLCMLGTAPIIGVMTRPESLILLGLAVIALLGLQVIDDKKKPSIWRTIAVIGICLLIVPSHPKTILFSPFYFFALFLVSKGFGVVYRVVSCLLLVLIIGLSFGAHVSRFSCEESHVAYNNLIRSQQLRPNDFLENPTQSLKQAFFNVNPTLYFEHLRFKSEYQVNWLAAPSSSNANVRRLGNLAIFIMLLLSSLLTIYGVISIFRAFRVRFYFVSTFLLSSVALVSLQVSKYFYESFFIVGLMSIAAAMTIPLSLGANKAKLSSILLPAVSLLFLFAIALSIVNFRHILPFGAWQGKGIPTIKLGTSSTSDTIEELKLIAQKCGVAEKKIAKHLLVDDFTYFALHQESRLQQYAFLNSLIISGPPGWTSKDLHLERTRGILVPCEILPNEVVGIATSFEVSGFSKTGMIRMCCISDPSSVDKIAPSAE